MYLMTKIKKNNFINYWLECQATRMHIYCWWECDSVQLSQEILNSFLKS